MQQPKENLSPSCADIQHNNLISFMVNFTCGKNTSTKPLRLGIFNSKKLAQKHIFYMKLKDLKNVHPTL